MRPIDADALMQSLGITNMDCDECAWQDKESSRCKRGGDFEDACCAIEDAPTVKPERKKGKWIGYNTEQDGWKRTDGSPVFMSCSECNGLVLNNGSAHWNFCPNCGAKMKGAGSEDIPEDIPMEYFESGGR